MRRFLNIIICTVMLLTMASNVHAVESTVTEESIQQPVSDVPAVETTQPTQPHEHSWTVTDTATCGQAGTVTKSCTCGAVETAESPASGNHTFATWTNTDSGTHIRVCSVCGKLEEAEHSYGQWQAEEDRHLRSCSVCGGTDYADHSWGSAVVVKKPTCKEYGYMGHSCSICGYEHVDTDNPIAKLTTHTYDSACDPECNVCGKNRTITHTISKLWTKDEKGHWHECTKCDEKVDYHKHDPSDPATEERDQVCLTCGYVIQAKKIHTHSFEKKWSTDEVGHWHACKTCSAEQAYGSHVFDNDCDNDCNTCEYERENAHNYEEVWQTTNREHWKVCTLCGEKGQREKHIPGPDASEEAAQLCTVCGFELAPVQEHTHDFGDIWLRDEQTHWQECSCGEVSVPEAHKWDEGVESRGDTVIFTCVLCGMEMTEVARGGFSWLTVILVILALVCIGGIAAMVYILKRGSLDEDVLDEDVLDEEEIFEQGEDPEEKQIDSFFESLDEDIRK